MVTRSTRGWSGQRPSTACSSRAIVLLPAATLPPMPITYGTRGVQVPEERLGDDAQVARRREAQVQQPREREVDVLDLTQLDRLVEPRGTPRCPPR